MDQIIIQSDWDDVSTDDVIAWIAYLEPGKFEIVRLNNTTPIKQLTYKIENNQCNIELQTRTGTVVRNTIRSFWYRRGVFTFPMIGINVEGDQSLGIAAGDIQDHIFREQQYLRDSLYGSLLQDQPVNTFQQNYTNKIENLAGAVKAGLMVPDTLITNDMRELLRFSAEHEQIIAKDISFPAIRVTFNKKYTVRLALEVQLLSRQAITELSKKYTNNPIAGYSFYQQYVPKKYELRIFFLKGKCYPMAIFSQANDKTKIDFRNYDSQRPNRCVAYILPPSVEQKINLLMQSLHMNCGSLDLIVTPRNEFVFLEVNPVGQFQWLSANCNYDIERALALELING